MHGVVRQWGRLLRHLGLVLLVAGLIGFGPSTLAAPPNAPLDTLSVAIDDNYPPYIFRDANGQLNGYLVDLWQAWSQATGVRVNLLATDWAAAQSIMAAGQANLIDTMFRTPEREKIYRFGQPYVDIPVSIFVHREIGGISDAVTLRGFLVGAKAGDACVEWLRTHDIGLIQTFDSYERMLRAAAEGSIKVFCADDPPAAYLLYRQGVDQQFRRAFSLYSGQFHRAVRHADAELLTWVEAQFAALPAQTRKDLDKKWLGLHSQHPADYVPYLAYSLFALLFLGLLLSGWTLTLRREVIRRTRQLREEFVRFQTLADSGSALIWTSGTDMKCNYFNQPWLAFTGRTLAQELGDGWVEGVHPDDVAHCMNVYTDAFAAREAFSMTYRLRRHDGAWRWLVDDGRPRYDSEGQFLGYIGHCLDITERKAAEAALQHLAHHDPLTGLPNRSLFRDRLEHALELARRHHSQLAVLFLDLDRFKNVNDTLGHPVGDALLCHVARAMEQQMRASDTLARLGGDEFVLLLEDDAAAHAAQLVASKLIELFAQPVVLEGHELFITTSLGISLYPHDGQDADTLLKHADLAMYRAKEQGRDNFQFYEATMGHSALERMQMESALRGAMARNELVLHYQPQLALDDLRLVGVEALVRWQHPEWGMVSPGRFIPVAEEMGLIADLGAWVLAESCRQLADWRSRGLGIPRVAVNLSVQQIERGDLVDLVRQQLTLHHLPPACLELEVTESMLMRQTDRALSVVYGLEELGVYLAVDDFGTGWSSLGYLKQLPVHRLKIDYSFVRDIGHDPNDEAITRAVIALGQSLGMEVVAEGVERAEQASFLRHAGCAIVQGFLYARPLAATALEAQWGSPELPPGAGA